MIRRNRRIQRSLSKTRGSFFGQIIGMLRGGDISDELWEELEELLIQADVGVETALDLMESVRGEVNSRGIGKADRAEELLRSKLTSLLDSCSRPYLTGERLLSVVLVVGVNGSGKTTSIAKLARFHQARGDRVMLAAADTYRAAAIDQLRVWGDRLKTEVISHQPGADPGAVLHDAIRAAQTRGANVLIADTAGRLHTKYNLMQELTKIHSVARKQVHEAPHETLLVLDATTGQNGLVQARHFQRAVEVTGAVLAKLDGTAKGGMAFAIAKELGIPIQFVGVGEGLDDLAEFKAEAFVEGLFESE